MNKWRPCIWENPYKALEYMSDGKLISVSFEAGADAMLETLRKEAFTKKVISQGKDAMIIIPKDYLNKFGNGVLVFIPDDKEQS